MKHLLSRLSKGITATLVVLMLLSACSTGSGTDKANEENTAGEAAAKPITLRLTLWGNPGELSVYQGAIKRFEAAHKNVTVKFEPIPTDYDTKLTTMIAGNEEPDVAMMESATLAFPLAEQDKWINLEEYLANDPTINLDKLVPGIVYSAEQGNAIGISPGPETFALYYNVDMFKAAGLEAPPSKVEDAWTWDEFVEVAKKLTLDENGKNATEPDFDPKRIKQYGINGANGWWGSWSNFIFSNGGDFVSEDGKTFALNQPESVEVFQKLADLVNVHHVAPSPVQAKNVPGTNIALQTGKVAMAIDGQWANFDLGNTKVNYDIALLPVMKEPITTVVGGMFSIFKSTKHPQESWELLKALLDPEATLELNHKGLWMPALRSWYEEPDLIAKWTADSPARTPGYKGAVIDMMLEHSHQTPTGYVKNFNKIMDIVNPSLDKLWLGKVTAQEAMDSIAAKAQEQVQGRRDFK